MMYAETFKWVLLEDHLTAVEFYPVTLDMRDSQPCRFRELVSWCAQVCALALVFRAVVGEL